MLSDEEYRVYMAHFSQRYWFKICDESEIGGVIKFIDIYWKKNHALVLSPELLNWQHYNKEEGTYSFVIAIHKKTKEIHALEGYILSSQFDSKIEYPIRWPAIWKIRDDVGAPGLGLMVHLYATKKVPTMAYGALGISDVAFPLYKKMCEIGYLNQWYIMHPEKETFKLIDNYANAPRCNIKASKSNKYFKECTEEFPLINDKILNWIPIYKSREYYVNRYLNHPIYKYHATKICDKEGTVVAIFFWRFCEAEKQKCIRIVDYFGANDALCGNIVNFQKMLRDENSEFIDFYNVGINKEYLEEGGFVDRKKTTIVLANYFEPFVLKNVDLNYAWHSKESIPTLFFKGDSDQDRPNTL